MYSSLDFVSQLDLAVLNTAIQAWFIALTIIIGAFGTALIWAKSTTTEPVADPMNEDEPEIIACPAGEDYGYHIDTDSLTIMAMEGPGELQSDTYEVRDYNFGYVEALQPEELDAGTYVSYEDDYETNSVFEHVLLTLTNWTTMRRVQWGLVAATVACMGWFCNSVDIMNSYLQAPERVRQLENLVEALDEEVLNQYATINKVETASKNRDAQLAELIVETGQDITELQYRTESQIERLEQQVLRKRTKRKQRHILANMDFEQLEV